MAELVISQRKASTWFVAGRLFLGAVRDFLEAEKLKGRQITWHEGAGWLEHKFTIVGELPDVRYIANRLREWANQINSEETK